MKNIVVIGGGISGLTTAFYIKKLSRDAGREVTVTLFEASGRVGGKIWSDKQNGYLCEVGANGFLDNKPFTLKLCDELGIEDKLLPSNENARTRFIYINGKLRELPSSPKDFVFSDILSLKGKLRIPLEIFTKSVDEEDETIADFVKRHLGEEALRNLVAPMVSGVFAGDPYRMSLKSAFPVMHQLEREGNGSLIRAAIGRMKKAKEMKKKAKLEQKKRTYKPGGAAGPGGVLTSFPDGIEYLPRALQKALGDSMRLNTRVTRVERRDGRYIVAYDGEQGPGAIEVDGVVVATPAYSAAGLMKYMDEKITSYLEKIPYTKLALICFGYDRSKIHHDLKGFGFLVPFEENKTILGSLWDSSIFKYRAPEGKVLLRMMVGGARAEDKAMLRDDDLIEAVKQDLRDSMGIEAQPVFIKIYRHRKAIPQYNAGHSNILDRLDRRLEEYKGMFLTGSAYRGVGTNDCVNHARITAEKVVNYIK